MMRKCIVSDMDGCNTTAPMDCVKAIKLAKSGDWGKNWSLQECLDNPDGSTIILKKLIQFKDGEYEFLTQDEFFLEKFN